MNIHRKDVTDTVAGKKQDVIRFLEYDSSFVHQKLPVYNPGSYATYIPQENTSRHNIQQIDSNGYPWGARTCGGVDLQRDSG